MIYHLPMELFVLYIIPDFPGLYFVLQMVGDYCYEDGCFGNEYSDCYYCSCCYYDYYGGMFEPKAVAVEDIVAVGAVGVL